MTNLLELFRANGLSPNSKSNNCRVYQIKYKPVNEKRFIFLVKCKESYSDPKGHIVSLTFANKDAKIGRRLISPLEANVKVHCHCPAFLYWGSAYNASQEKYSFKRERENREPNIRDPHRQNKICKHLVAATKSFRNKGFKQISKGRMAVTSSIEELSTISMNECFTTIKYYLDEHQIDSKDFFQDFNEDNFEDKLLEVGLLI